MRNLLINLGTMVASLLVFLLLCEFIIFRFIFLPTDIPDNEFIEKVIRNHPNQSGIYRIKNEIIADYRINAQGWNSKYSEYPIIVIYISRYNMTQSLRIEQSTS